MCIRDSLLVIKNEKIQALLAKKKRKVCWKCRRQNCLSAQVSSRRLKLEKKFVGKCDGKAITFKQLKLQQSKEDEAAPKANGSTAKISPPAVSDSDSDGEMFNSFISTIKQNNSEDFGYNYVQNIAGFSINGVVTEDNIPSYKVMKETEFIADKSCIVCPEENMDLEALSEHYCYEHTITFMETYEDDLETFQEMARKHPGDSKLFENMSPGNNSSGEEQVSDLDTFFDTPKSGSSSDSSSSIKSSRSKGNAQKAGSSSDSSSSIKSSRSKGNRKSKSKGSRDIESIRTQMISQKSFNENKFKEVDSSFKVMEKILENQTKGFETINTSIAENESVQKEHVEKLNTCNSSPSTIWRQTQSSHT